MSPDAKVWVYQSNRVLNSDEFEILLQKGEEFIDDWAAHGAKLDASFDVLYNRFIVIAVDEKQAMASGCSIDKSVQFVKQLELSMNLNLFNRMDVAYRENDSIKSCSLTEFEKLAKENHINESTIVFNNMVNTKSAFETEWEVPLAKSWQSRVLTS